MYSAIYLAVQNGFILLLFATLVMLSVFLWIVPALRLFEPEWIEHTVGDNDSLVGVLSYYY
mgnify:CR=1 FL=1